MAIPEGGASAMIRDLCREVASGAVSPELATSRLAYFVVRMVEVIRVEAELQGLRDAVDIIGDLEARTVGSGSMRDLMVEAYRLCQRAILERVAQRGHEARELAMERNNATLKTMLQNEPTTAKTCCVCHEALVDNAPREDRWSWGPDGLHCHARCEPGFAAVLRSRGLPVPDYVAAKERNDE